MHRSQQRSNQSNETNNTNDYNRFCLYKMVVNFEIVVQISKIKISTKGAPFLNILYLLLFIKYVLVFMKFCVNFSWKIQEIDI